MKITHVVLGVVLASSAAACGSSAATSAQTSKSSASSPASDASRYQAAVRPCTDGQAAFNRTTAGAAAYNLVAAAALVLANACSGANSAVGRITWPAPAEADIRAMVTATAPVLGDLRDLADGAAVLSRDSSTASAAAQTVQADFGLPNLVTTVGVPIA